MTDKKDKDEKLAVAATPDVEKTEKPTKTERPYGGILGPYFGGIFEDTFKAMDRLMNSTFEEFEASFRRHSGDLERLLELESPISGIEMHRLEDKYLVKFKVGKDVKPEELSVKYKWNILEISRDFEEKGKRSSAYFQAWIRGADPSRIEARYSDGTVTIEMPLIASYVPKTIPIKTG